MSKWSYGICIYKKEKNDYKILLCKSVSSKEKYGCIKGSIERNESVKQCAKREFYEETSISVEVRFFEEYFEQINTTKSVGVWLVNYENVPHINDFFVKEKLQAHYLSWENSKVKLFSISELPKIKDNQKKLLNEIIDFLKNKH